MIDVVYITLFGTTIQNTRALFCVYTTRLNVHFQAKTTPTRSDILYIPGTPQRHKPSQGLTRTPAPPRLHSVETKSRAPIGRATPLRQNAPKREISRHRDHVPASETKNHTHQNASTLHTLRATSTQDSFRAQHHHLVACEMPEGAPSFR